MTLHRTFIATVAVAAIVALGGCGGATKSATAVASGQQHVLHLAFYADMATVDPDVFYDIEGGAVTQSVYDGLLRYAPGTTTLQGALAQSWSASPDGLTYTFHLRSASFSDGTPVTSAAVETSFKRRVVVNQGPAYMLADVRSYSTPSPSVFVVHLKRPVSDFLNLMASLWGPKVINPAVLASHKADSAKQFLKTHAAGTGPFVLTRFQQGTGYVMTRNPHYWGSKPYFDQVRISIQPDVSTQLLELQRGGLDAILHGVPVSSLGTLTGTNGIAVHKFSSLDTVTLAINQAAPGLGSAAVRRAVVDALNVPTLVSNVFNNTAGVMTTPFPQPLLPAGTGVVTHPDNLAQIKAALPKGLKLTVVFTPDSSGVERRFADFMRQSLAQVGVTVVEQQVQLATVFGYRNNPKQAASIYISTPTPDAAAPDAWARIVWHSSGGLNFFNYSNHQVDSLIDAGLRSPNVAQSAKSYAQAGVLGTTDAGEVPIAQVQDVMVTRTDLTSIQHVPAYPWTLDLGALGRG